jgi:hypothetical protein
LALFEGLRFFAAVFGDLIRFTGVLGLDWLYRRLDGTRIIRIRQGENTDFCGFLPEMASPIYKVRLLTINILMEFTFNHSLIA